MANTKPNWYVWADAKPDGSAALELAVGVRRPGLDLGCAAVGQYYHAQLPEASQPQLNVQEPGRCRTP